MAINPAAGCAGSGHLGEGKARGGFLPPKPRNLLLAAAAWGLLLPHQSQRFAIKRHGAPRGHSLLWELSSDGFGEGRELISHLADRSRAADSLIPESKASASLEARR